MRRGPGLSTKPTPVELVVIALAAMVVSGLVLWALFSALGMM
jgi:hypothetical protein